MEARDTSRLFFHSVTGEPYAPTSLDPDSEEELSEEWLQEYEDREIDEYTDICLSDKAFFKAWNRYVRENKKFADCEVRELLQGFCQKYERVLANFEVSLRLHLITLFDNNVLSGDDVYAVLMGYKSRLTSA